MGPELSAVSMASEQVMERRGGMSREQGWTRAFEPCAAVW